jgi:phytoene dehydrogenase-like protein
LLDRPGLEWAFQAVGLDLTDHVTLQPIEAVYEVGSAEDEPCLFYADQAETAAGFGKVWPGSGKRYLRFVAEMNDTYQRLAPLLRVSQPGPGDLLRTGAWREVPFLLRSLGAILAHTGLPQPVQAAIAVWTHIAGQRPDEAPSPLAFVPALIHSKGAFYTRGGIGAIPRALAQVATSIGIEFHYNSRVHAIRCERGKVRGVETQPGTFWPAEAVVSNAPGLATYLDLVDATPPRVRRQLERLPLQSPGVCAYLAVRSSMKPPYLRFRLPDQGGLCRLFIRPGVMEAALERAGWWPARLLAPMSYERAEQAGPAGQRAYLAQLLAEEWWRDQITEFRVLTTRTPAEWGAQFHLYGNSMNPVMTARLMRAGRLGHRSPYVQGLYLAGSATHPGQWVSFCALSGILAADCLWEDYG